MRYLIYCLMFCAFFAFGCEKLPEPKAAELPEKIDSESLKSKISKEKGKVVIVNFWTTTCPYCKDEIRELKKLRKQFEKNELLILGVAMDKSRERIRDFAESQDINYVLYQGERDVVSTFRLQGVPTTYIYGPQGDAEKTKPGFISFEKLESIVNKLLE